jgi:type II secretory pathway pseudopilin PulG
MTIIEVLFAIVILSGVMLSLARFGQSFTRANRDAASLATASDLATARLEAIRQHSSYGTLLGAFNSDVETEGYVWANPSMNGFPGFTRRTDMVRTVTDTSDYTTVTVTVTAGVLKRPLTKTLVIGAFQ